MIPVYRYSKIHEAGSWNFPENEYGEFVFKVRTVLVCLIEEGGVGLRIAIYKP